MERSKPKPAIKSDLNMKKKPKTPTHYLVDQSENCSAEEFSFDYNKQDSTGVKAQ